MKIDDLSLETGLSVNYLLRIAMKLLILVIQAKAEGKQLVLVDPAHPENRTEIEIMTPL